jgi:hypothetical protein
VKESTEVFVAIEAMANNDRLRSIVHDGAATLRVVTGPELCLEGEYWTNRKSTGEIHLKRATTETADGFSE